MRRLSSFLLCLIMFFPALSYAEYSGDTILNRISMRLSAEQWMASNTALVTVGINAGVSDADLANIQENTTNKLKEISNAGDWHIVSFDRSEDAAGLEKVQMSAQARLPSTALPALRNKAKAISKPGETFTLDNVQFTPSEDDMRAAEATLRNNIYLQAKAELDRLNKMYPDQKFYVHEINFIPEITPLPVVNTMYMKAGAAAAVAPRGNIAVGDKFTLNATVVFAASPDQALTKLLH